MIRPAVGTDHPSQDRRLPRLSRLTPTDSQRKRHRQPASGAQPTSLCNIASADGAVGRHGSALSTWAPLRRRIRLNEDARHQMQRALTASALIGFLFTFAVPNTLAKPKCSPNGWCLGACGANGSNCTYFKLIDSSFPVRRVMTNSSDDARQKKYTYIEDFDCVNMRRRGVTESEISSWYDVMPGSIAEGLVKNACYF